MGRKSDEKKKQKSILEEMFRSMMYAALRAAFTELFDDFFSIFGDSTNKDDLDSWIEEYMEIDEVKSLIEEGVENLYSDYEEEYC